MSNTCLFLPFVRTLRTVFPSGFKNEQISLFFCYLEYQEGNTMIALSQKKRKKKETEKRRRKYQDCVSRKTKKKKKRELS